MATKILTASQFMPRLRRVSGQDAIRSLEALVFAQERQRGSHVILVKQTAEGKSVVLSHCIANWQSGLFAEY